MELAKIRRILVPTDFSNTAGETIRAAQDLAKVFHAGIELLHVTTAIALLPPPVDVVPIAALLPRMAQHVQEKLDEEAKQVRASGVPCDIHIVDGSPATEIVRRAEETNADLIIMGTHGHGGLAHAVLGSVTERLVRLCPVPILTIRASA